MMSCTPQPADITQFIRVAASSELQHLVGDCEHPVRLGGTRLLVEAGTGRVTGHIDAADLPGGALLVRCGNRRSSVCVPCSTLYKFDAYNLIAAGLRGGKDMPASVAEHPRLFVTVTAPSFGAVHLGPDRQGTPRLCHYRPSGDGPSCGTVHDAGDPLIGTAVDPGSYDYAGQVLFNAHAGVLWSRFTIEVRRALAAVSGLSRRAGARQVRVVFAKVAEYQSRGSVHFHAIVRLDGPDGPDGPDSVAPGWATTSALTDAIGIAATRTSVSTPEGRRHPSRSLTFGTQLDIRPVASAQDGPSDVVVARYIAKYATKSTEAVGLTLTPIYCRACAGAGCTTAGEGVKAKVRLCSSCHGTGRREGTDLSTLGDHARTLVETCWRLGVIPEFADLRLRRWAHMIGFRGHFTTKSLSYSTTFGELRQERRDWTASRDTSHADELLVIDDWHYTGRASAVAGGGRHD